MPTLQDEPIVIGIKGTVVAVDRRDGAILWKTPLKGGGFVNVARDGDDIFAATKGELFCLDGQDGRIRWSNPLRGLGLGFITIARGSDGTAAIIAQYEQQQQQQAATGAAAAAVT